MTTSSTIYAALAIFIGVNLIVQIKSDANILANSETTEMKMERLPREYHRELSQLLSPDIFKQSDPFQYLLQKAVKIPPNTLQLATMDLDRGLSLTIHQGRIPAVYLPYARLLSWLLPCIHRLDYVKTSIKEIQKKSNTNNSLRSQLDDSTFDLSTNLVLPQLNISSRNPEVLPLYSSDIFTDPNPPSVLINKLLQVPGNSFLRVGAKLTETRANLFEDHDYAWYEITLHRFLISKDSGITLRNLQRWVARLKQLTLSTPTHAVDQSQQKQ